LKATGLTVTVTRVELGNATDPSVTVTVVYIQVSTVYNKLKAVERVGGNNGCSGSPPSQNYGYTFKIWLW
jgi:hypothetical protein